MNQFDSEEPEKTLSERAYRAIREDIVSGALVPSQKLKIDMLRQRYGLNAGPLREALSRLAGDNLVEVLGQRGFAVAPIYPRDAEEIGDLRKMLEAEALGRSIPRGDSAWEERLIAAYHRLSRQEVKRDQGIEELAVWEQRNFEFHEATVAACDSLWLLRVRQQLFRQHERYRRFSRIMSVTTRAIHDEHEALFEACIARDVGCAQEVIASHIQRTTDAVTSALETNGQRQS
ncbi:GntR family transcriptional regulator [Pukyongiella litopenaei]|uniref:FCD domain-containing protein n=1 Tax=Pukyongiella litopenaei TaxID=2605946 RepID=A0A2S0MQL3_9RHOB|nr:FCD domain-containing protein [Pukyongiella litopenaei]AVO38179.1 FCD domain-containing protein [Pukyongiella litopenaei]